MEFRPADFLSSSRSNAGAYLIILNTPLRNFEVFRRVWANSRYRICADGGANRLHDLFTIPREKRRGEFWRRDDFLPNEIHGDLDSIRGDVQEYYEANDIEITQDHDQYSTDFGKVMSKIIGLSSSEHHTDVIILGSLSGRVDHGIGLLHDMYREMRGGIGENDVIHHRLWLISDASCSFILPHGKWIIKTAPTEFAARATLGWSRKIPQDNDPIFTRNAGILPIYGLATISTEGFEWDIQDWETEMGGKVSTSNHVLDLKEGVTVKTDHPVLFTIELAEMKSSTDKAVENSKGVAPIEEAASEEWSTSGLQIDGRVDDRTA